jgi:hypothetical protein
MTRILCMYGQVPITTASMESSSITSRQFPVHCIAPQHTRALSAPQQYYKCLCCVNHRHVIQFSLCNHFCPTFSMPKALQASSALCAERFAIVVIVTPSIARSFGMWWSIVFLPAPITPILILAVDLGPVDRARATGCKNTLPL